MKKNGFTLIELLAVIVILAIILVIAVPQINKTINEARNAALVSSAKLIATTAEKRKLENDTLGINEEIKCADLVKTSDDYADCDVTFNDAGDALVTIIGDGRFKGKYICNGTKTSAVVSEEACEGISGGNTSTPEVVYCTYDGDLQSGTKYENGIYTYVYKRELNIDDSYWREFEDEDLDGWGVALTNPVSTASISGNFCTFINNKPVVSMQGMFFNSQAASIDLSEFNTSNVVNMNNMFSSSQATNIDLSNFDTSNVTDMTGMFSFVSAPTIDVSSFVINDGVAVEFMFEGEKLNNIIGLDTSNLSMPASMFSNNFSETLKISGKAGTMAGLMFSYINAGKLDLTDFDMSDSVDMTNMFMNSGVGEIVGLNINSDVDVTQMFEAAVIDSLKISGKAGKSTSRMFAYSDINSVDLSNFDMSDTTDVSYMFAVAYTDEIKGLDLSSAENIENIFLGISGDTLKISGNAGSASAFCMFSAEDAYGSGINLFGTNPHSSIDLTGFDMSNLTDMSYMFYDNDATTINLSGVDTNKVTNMDSMFLYSSVSELLLPDNFGKNVTNMAYMFADTNISDLTKLNTSNVTNMAGMFSNSAATILDLSSFDTSKVTDTTDMFKDSSATTGYARTQTDADKLNASSEKPSGLTFIVK